MKKNIGKKDEIKKTIYKKQGIKANGYWQDAEFERLITEYMQKRSREELDKRLRV